MSNSKIKTVGVLGLGIIGSRVAENLRKAGYSVFVWSRSARAVPNFLASPLEIADVADVVQVFVRNGESLLSAMQSMAPSLRTDQVIINHATVSPEATKKAAEICDKSGALFLDAPFTGSKMAAQNGKLVYYLGGDEHVLERVRPVLEASSTKILQMGKIGDATVLKIATNLLTAVIVEALAEASAITRASGVPLDRLLEALENNANYSTLVGMKMPAIINGNFEPHFSLRNMLKDAEFAQSIARAHGLELPALDRTAAIMSKGVAAGRGDLDFSVIAHEFSLRPKDEEESAQKTAAAGAAASS